MGSVFEVANVLGAGFCDRGNDRIQVFDKNDPALGKACRNPGGDAGKCRFVAEQLVSEHTNNEDKLQLSR
jgi:hypothetical protein